MFLRDSGFVQLYAQAGLRKSAQSLSFTLGITMGEIKVIYYKKRRHYKYTLFADYPHPTELKTAQPFSEPLISLDTNGMLTVKAGYAWDGPSRPAIHTDNFLKGSLIHDALYQLMRNGHLEQEHRKYADRLLRQICIESGMSPVRAGWVYLGVRFGGASSAKPDLLQAP